MKFKKGNRWRSSSGKIRYTKWRKVVFELNKRKHGMNRDYVCVKCRKRRKTTRVLHAHHIFSWDKYPKLRYERGNGVVLCWKCHNKFHNTYKWDALENPRLLEEYIKSNNKSIKEYIDARYRNIK